MLTGNQIAAARILCGFIRQADLAAVSGVSEPTIARAELARGEVPDMSTKAMRHIMLAFERSGLEFYLENGESAVGGLGMRVKEHENADT